MEVPRAEDKAKVWLFFKYDFGSKAMTAEGTGPYAECSTPELII